MKTSRSTSIGQLIDILDIYGVKHADRNTRISKENPVPHAVYKDGAFYVRTYSLSGKMQQIAKNR